uniref:tigger transposable element-derived protein 1-like n=1 Tax=Myxine glutinosa TaxID=7769 RepID=UPI00358E3D77
MEKMLMTWMEDQLQKCVPLSLMMIHAKAKSLFDVLKVQAGTDYTETFTASKGWLCRFKRRNNMHNVRVSGEAASADAGGAARFREVFDKLIVEKGYLPEQIFNVDETGLYWKRMPERTYIHQEAKTMPGFKAFKDRLTLLLGGNVAGFKLEPFCIYRSENPRAFKNIVKHTLPVYYRSNRKAWMTQALFEDWFLSCFVPQVREYRLQQSIACRIVLVLDNAPGHPQHLDDLHADVKVVYLPPNMTAILQPMDQGAIATFKAYYLQATFAQAIAAAEEEETTLRDFWKGYNILQCIRNVASAWEEVTAWCMNGIWKHCMLRYVNSFKGFNKDEVMDGIGERIVRLAHTFELEVDVEDMEVLFDFTPGELTNEDLLEIEEQRDQEESERKKEEEKDDETPQKMFTIKGMAEGFAVFNKGRQLFESMDTNVDLLSKFDRQLQQTLACYREIYDEKRKQTVQPTLDDFFLKKDPIASTSNASATTSALSVSPRPNSSPSPPPSTSSSTTDDSSTIDDPGS